MATTQHSSARPGTALASWRDGPAKRTILEWAAADGWIVVSVEDDWATVF
jgi:hypothetical protein